MHATWERHTGQRLTLDPMRERVWFDWLKRGLTESDLVLLVNSIQARIRAGKLSPTSLKFRYVIGDTDQAEEDVAELKARRRGMPSADQEAKESVLRATGREGGTACAASGERAGEVAARLEDRERARKALREWMEANK
jgi:hypothetical protein